jgi:hypothetical protein
MNAMTNRMHVGLLVWLGAALAPGAAIAAGTAANPPVTTSVPAAGKGANPPTSLPLTPPPLAPAATSPSARPQGAAAVTGSAASATTLPTTTRPSLGPTSGMGASSATAARVPISGPINNPSNGQGGAAATTLRPPGQPAAAAVAPKPSPFVPLPQPPAATPARVAEAREHFARGVQDFRDGALDAALAEFLRAQDLAPSYRLHFNIAQVHYELRNYAEAKRSFQQYLAGADAELPADRRVLVEAELAKLDRLVAQFSVKTSVPGVQIAVDGIPAGLVSRDNLVLVNTNPGVRRVTAAKSGFLPASMLVTVAPGERRKLVFELAPVALATTSFAPSVTAGVAAPGLTTAYAAPPPRTKLWASVATAATLATATGVFALLTRNAHGDFERELGRVPNDRASVDGARSTMSHYALVADLLAIGTAAATGLSLYFAFSDDGEPERRLAHAPAGLGVRGGF